LFASRTLGSYAALFGSFPFLIAMLEQQDSMLILLVTTGCWVALRKERWTLAGVMLGIGLIRFPIFIPLTLIIAFWKPITLKGFAFSSCIVSLISLALVGPSGIASYVDYLLRMGRESSAQISALYQIDPRTMPTIRGLCFIAGFPHLYVPFALFILLAAWKFMRSTRRSQDKYAFAICAALLVSPHSLMHDFTMLALPLVLFSSPITLSLMPFYLAPLDFLLYPHAQAGLAVPLLATVALAFQYTDKQCSTTFSAETPGAHVRTLNRPDSDIARRQMCRARSLRRSPRLRDAYDEIPIYCLNSS
jgi:hypothetical protein